MPLLLTIIVTVFLPLVLGSPAEFLVESPTEILMESPAEFLVETPEIGEPASGAPFQPFLPENCNDQPALALVGSVGNFQICDAAWLHAITPYTYRQGDVHYLEPIILFEDGSVIVDVVNIQSNVDPNVPETTRVGYCAAPQMGCTPDLPWFPGYTASGD